MAIDKEIRETIRRSLGLPDRQGSTLEEAYVVEPKKYSLKTDFLSDKTKRARVAEFERSTEALNEVSAKLDTASRDDADAHSSEFRSLKVDEARCLNESFLRSRFLDNIDDPASQLSMDTLTFMRLERDFGTFDDWQKDFIACAMASRGGFAVTAYNVLLKRYMNLMVDSGGANMPVGCFPIVVIDANEGAYYRDYVGDRRSYVIAMMKELRWDVIEERIKKAERIAKAAG